MQKITSKPNHPGINDSLQCKVMGAININIAHTHTHTSQGTIKIELKYIAHVVCGPNMRTSHMPREGIFAYCYTYRVSHK